MSATIIDGTCSNFNSKEERASFGHNDNMSAIQRNIDQSRSQDYLANNDPLEQIDKIELVQQSDTTVHLIADEEVTTDNNLSCLSIAPIQNLLRVFNDNMDEAKATMGKSPNGVEQCGEHSPNARDEKSAKKIEDRSNQAQAEFKSSVTIDLPTFELNENLRLNLPQPVINRCSFYSIIHGVNKAVQDMAVEDQNNHIEETKDEDSALVLAVNGPIKWSSSREGPQVELAVLDEEKFLLAAIESRGEEEMRIRACPATFAEAIGEVESSDVSDPQFTNKDQSENPLSVLSSSRTQLWKPSRSWWEAKSGKNPWIEPKHHNKRWRYLWPLIHYHKFLAKCIKKLKRNNVDVKTSLSPVSAFLREEVCAVSDHLAAASKFTSEDWMEGLPHFHGWTGQDEESQLRLKKICQSLPMRSLAEPADVDSALLRNQIDLCFLKAWKAQKEQMENGGNERNDEELSDNSEFKPKGMNHPKQNYTSNSNGSKPPRHGGPRGSRNSRMSNNQRVPHGANRQWRGQRGRRMYGNYPLHDHSMMMPPQVQHGMYPPHFNASFHGGYVPGHYMHQSMNNSIAGWNHAYGGNDYSNLNISVSGEWEQYHGNQYEPSMENEGSFYVQCDDSVANTSVASFNHFDGLHYNGNPLPAHTLSQQSSGGSSTNTRDQTISNTPSDSFEEGTLNEAEPITNTMHTPAKENPMRKHTSNVGTPESPSWAHLHMVPGLGTPLAQHGGHTEQIQGYAVKHSSGITPNPSWANAKPLFMNPNFNHHFPQRGPIIPPSPATQFTMSPQANSQTSAYFANYYPRSNPAMSAMQQGSFAQPTMQQNCPENLNESSMNDGQTLTEETSSETTSETEN